MNYDYFYNQEPEQYIHYQMPKILFTNEQLNKLSLDAKFLYCLLLDRAKSSFQKGFIDKDGRVYVHFAHAEIMNLLNRSRPKVSEYFKELDSDKGGIGLVERRQKVGIGKSDVIYVKNFAKSLDSYTEPVYQSDMPYTYFCDDISVMRFKHYQVPKMLFFDKKLQDISNTAKMAYSFMLDRIQLSLANGWKDELGRIYIIFPQKELQQLLGCSIRTVKSALKELDIKDGVGLIDRKRQGLNNPDIIYLLDFTSSLKYRKAVPEDSSLNIGGAECEHREVQNLNIGGAKSEHQEVQNLNIGSAKSEHREVQNLNIGGAKSEHIIYKDTDVSNTDFNDTDINNTDFNDTDFNLSFNHAQAENENFEQSDRQNDRTLKNNKNMSFSEILSALGYNNKNRPDFIPEDESYFTGCKENERGTDTCTIPYWLKDNPEAMRKALEFLFSYSEYKSDNADDNKIKILLGAVIEALVEMLRKGSCVLYNESTKNKEVVKYHQIIDLINHIMQTSSLTLTSWLNSFKNKWEKQLSENKNIYNPKVYIKASIWNSMKNFEFEVNNSCLQADYDYEHGLFSMGKNSDGFNAEEYNCCINCFQPENDSITDNDSKENENLTNIQEAEQTETPKQPKQEQTKLTEITEYGEDFIENIIKRMAKENNRPISHYLTKGTYKILGDDGNYYVLDDNGEYYPYDEKIGVSA